MPPKRANNIPNHGPQLSLRFKYGKHTVFQFVDSEAPLASVTPGLLAALRDTASEGLAASVTSTDRDTLPAEGTPYQVVYGKLKSIDDHTQGFALVDNANTMTPRKLELGYNSVLAFVILKGDAAEAEVQEGDVTFVVEWPQQDEETA